MGRRNSGPKITIQQILNMLSPVPEEGISIKDILAKFKEIKISVRETAVYFRIHKMEPDGLIQPQNKEFSRRGRVGMGPLQYLLTEKRLIERDRLNRENPPPPKQEPIKETPGTKKLSISDYLQMPVIKPLE